MSVGTRLAPAAGQADSHPTVSAQPWKGSCRRTPSLACWLFVSNWIRAPLDEAEDEELDYKRNDQRLDEFAREGSTRDLGGARF